MDAEGEPVEVPCTDEVLAAYVFKTIADPFVGKLSYVKVISGKLAADSAPINSAPVSRSVWARSSTSAAKQEDTAYITAGDIGAVTKLALPKPAMRCATRKGAQL